MTLAHLSDTHLGFRAYGRTNDEGFNLREADVMDTFRACLEAIAERDPDLVVHSGDLFHAVRPSNATIVQTFRAINALQTRRGGKPFVLIGGNHDTPRLADSGNSLRIFQGIPGVFVETEGPRRLGEEPEFRALGVEVLCVPNKAFWADRGEAWRPALRRKHAVLTVHAMAAEALPAHGAFSIERALPEAWTYVALGDYHVRRRFAPNACYPGSTDFTSSNVWEEAATPKGWAWYDSERGELEFVPLATRRVLDLPLIDAAELSAEALTERLLAQANWPEGEAPIVRQRVANARAELRGWLDPQALRGLQARCLNYQLRLEAPASDPLEAWRQAGSAQTLEDSWRTHLAEAALAGGVSKARLEEIGLELLKEARELDAAPA